MIFRIWYKKLHKGLSSVLLQCTRLTDRQTDRQTDRRTDRILIARPRLHSTQRGKSDDRFANRVSEMNMTNHSNRHRYEVTDRQNSQKYLQ